jgi:hypothetical protein
MEYREGRGHMRWTKRMKGKKKRREKREKEGK